MTTVLAPLERTPIGGGLASGLATAVCCGGLPMFASIGLEEPAGVRTQALVGALISLPAGLTLLPFSGRQIAIGSPPPGAHLRSGTADHGEEQP